MTHWSALLADQLGISFASVARIWRKWNLQPWRVETFKFSTDPELDAKIRDVVGLYLNPPDKAVVLCVDEKSQVQALDRTAPILAGVPEKQTHDYIRNGYPRVKLHPEGGLLRLARANRIRAAWVVAASSSTLAPAAARPVAGPGWAPRAV